MLATHNSASYAKQIGWTKFLPKVFSRCQKLSLREQYDLGVRYFDLRVTYYKGRYVTAHGLARYNIDFDEALREISGFPEKCMVGVMIEDTFLRFKGSLVDVYKMINESNVYFHYLISKKTGEYYYLNSNVDKTNRWIIPSAKMWDILMPKIDCKDLNKLFTRKELIEDERVNIVDFVETMARQ